MKRPWLTLAACPALLLFLLSAPVLAEGRGEPASKVVLPPDRTRPALSETLEAMYREEVRGPREDEGLRVKEPPTKLSLMVAAKFGMWPQGKVGDSATLDVVSYSRGWSNGRGFDLALGMDVGFIGFFLDVAYDVHASRGTTARHDGWYKYTDLRFFTLCPGIKIKFAYWLHSAYAGDAPWAMEWYDYLLNAYPYVKVGFGPAWLDRMDKATHLAPYKAKYWESGLSFTGFLVGGIQWSPFTDLFAFFFEAGVQILVPMTNMGPGGVGENPENLVTFPVRIGLAFEF